jgi:hypothetical protein
MSRGQKAERSDAGTRCHEREKRERRERDGQGAEGSRQKAAGRERSF